MKNAYPSRVAHYLNRTTHLQPQGQVPSKS